MRFLAQYTVIVMFLVLLNALFEKDKKWYWKAFTLIGNGLIFLFAVLYLWGCK